MTVEARPECMDDTLHGRLAYTSDEHRPVITRGAPTSVSLTLVPVEGRGGEGR